MSWPRVPTWRVLTVLVAALLAASCAGASVAPTAPPSPGSAAVLSGAAEVSAGPPSGGAGADSPAAATGLSQASADASSPPGATPTDGAGSPASPPAPATAPTPTPAPSDHAASSGKGWIVGRVTMAPTCPIVTVPPNPSCAPRAVPGAMIVAIDSRGAVAAQATSAANGSYVLDLAPGTYTIEGRQASGVMRPPMQVRVTLGAAGVRMTVDLRYDSGIR